MSWLILAIWVRELALSVAVLTSLLMLWAAVRSLGK